MKKSIILFLVLLFSIQINTFSFSSKSIPQNNYNLVVEPKIDNPTDAALKALVKMKTGDIERMMGRKLKFKERLALKLLKFNAKKNAFNEEKSKDGKTAETLGIISIVSLLVFPFVTIPLGILAIVYGSRALKVNPNDKAANTGKVLGIVSLALLLLFLIAIIVIVSAFTINLWGG